MDKPMSGIGFKLMSLMFKVRDFFRPRLDVLKEAGIESGVCTLDYGCGPGSYILPLAKLVGPSGKIYALDIHPLAIKKVKKIAARKGIENIETIESDCRTGLSDNHVNVVLLYDTFHNLSQPDDVMGELHRVLKSDGTLSFSDHHMKEKDIIAGVTDTGMFKLSKKGNRTYSFSKVG
jgi:ubiquinone/menaquinone biosynthesis C-methylase UbiE